MHHQQILFVTEVTGHYEALIHDIRGADFKDFFPASQELLEKIRKKWRRAFQ